MQTRLFAANWKMHLGPQETVEYLRRFVEVIQPAPGRELWFFPPAVSLQAASSTVLGREDIHIGAQDVHWEPKGAFTGAISVPLARDAGAAGALVGHSERRHVFGETDEECARKVRAILGADLTAFLCVGEKLEQRETGQTEAVVLRQLRAGLQGVAPAELDRVVVAYEPVWAIGTGRNATPEDAAAVHAVIRNELTVLGMGNGSRILYGGSVNARNALALLAQPEIDGVLVGGASLDPDGWAEIVGLGG
jgi:triosephosphate isomerase (TIM)